jgi:PPM family protein phosphatase
MPSVEIGPLCPTFVLKHASASDLGMRRTTNQDALASIITDDPAAWATRGHLLMVADGMGAHAAGELASRIAVETIPHTYFKHRDLYPPAALRQAIRDANTAIHNKGQSSISFQGMGTTCSCLVLLPQGALVAHIGDSRVYRLRGQTLEQLTFDHSLVWEMGAAGKMAPEDVPAYIPKNVITRSLGPHSTVHIDLEGPYSAHKGDLFLLCSDGLSGQITDEEIGALLQCLEPSEAVSTLVDLANFRGGPDNISVIVARVDGDMPADADLSFFQNGATYSSRWSAASLLSIGVCLGMTAYFAYHKLWTAVAVSGVAVFAAIMAALAFRSQPVVGELPPAQSIGGPYGDGPHRKVQCPPNGKIMASLAEIAKKLKDLPNDPQTAWAETIKWQPFDEKRADADSAAERGDFTDAIRKYSDAIRYVMKQVREHRPTVDGSDAF